MRRFLLPLLLTFVGIAATPAAASRIKDIADVEGVRANMLVGYGLVVGLNGTGDSLNRAIFTRESLIGMLERLGVNARDTQLRTQNVAAVMVTATLPPFARQGTRIDVTISALGDAKSLLGGTLLVTPLLGADGEVYAVAQGPVAAGIVAKGQAASVTKGVPTSGRIAEGAIVEREVGFELAELKRIRLALRNPDLTTARRISAAVNAYLKTPAARTLDPATVEIEIPPSRAGDAVGIVAEIERLRVEPDQEARVVIDEANGIIVMGENVRLSTVAIAQGNLTIRITETPQVSQPAPFAPGSSGIGEAEGEGGVQFAPGGGAATTVVPRTGIEIDEGAEKRLAIVPATASLRDLVNGLNALGVGPRDMIQILHVLKAAGALLADIEVM